MGGKIVYKIFIVNVVSIHMLETLQLLTFLNWDSLHARLKSHKKLWSYKKKKHKKIKI